MFECRLNRWLPCYLLLALAYAAPVLADDSDLMAHWRFDAGAGTLVADNAGVHDGSMVSGTGWGTGSPSGSGHAVFDGTNDSILVEDLSVTGSELTLSCWFRVDDFGVRDARLLSKANGDLANDHWWMLSTISVPYSSNDYYLRFRLKTGETTTTLVGTDGPQLTTGTWTHVTATYDGSTMRLYQDGALVGSTAKSGLLAVDPAIPVTIGNQPGGARPFDGGIDDVRVYSRALPASEVIRLMLPPAAPTAASDSYSLDENETLNVTAPGILANDADANGDVLTSTLVSGAAHGVVTLHPDGSFTYTPAPGFFGGDTFTYRALDGALSSPATVVTVTVHEVPDTPSAPGGLVRHFRFDEGTGPTASDVSGSHTAALVNGASWDGPSVDASPSHLTLDGVNDRLDLGTLDLRGSALTIACWIRIDDFDVADARIISKATGRQTDDHWWMLSTMRTPFNDPTAAPFLRFRLKAGGSTTTLLGAGATLPAGQWVHAAAVYDGSAMRLYQDGVFVGGTPKSGAIAVAPSVPVAVGNQPAVTDGRPFDGGIDDLRIYERALTQSEIQELLVTQSPPTALPDVYAIAEDEVLIEGPATGVLANDWDADLDPLTATLVSGPDHGTLNLQADGSFQFTPDTNFAGSDSFTYVAADEISESPVTTVTLVIQPQQDPPLAATDAYTTQENTTLTVSTPGILANDIDVDGDLLTVALIDDVAHGTLSLQPDGSFSYVPNSGFFGEDSFTYSSFDGVSVSPTTSVALTVLSVLDPPIAANDQYDVVEDQTLMVGTINGVLTNDLNAEANPLSATLLVNVQHGTLTLQTSGSFEYAPNPNYFGADQFTYVASNGSSSNPAVVSLLVAPVADPPQSNTDTYTVARGQTLVVGNPAVGLLANDNNLDGNAMTAALVTTPQHGTLALNADGTFTYVHLGAALPEDSFTYRADNGTPGNVVAVTILVAAEGLVAHWPLDEGAGNTALDVAGGSSSPLRNGTAWGGVAPDGSPGHLQFDGVNDRVDLGTFDLAGNAMTIACWINVDDFEVADARIISKATGRQTEEHWWMLSTIRTPFKDPNADVFLRFRLKAGGSTTTLLATSGALPTGTWLHAAAVYDGSTMRLYKDGVLVGSMPKSGAIAVAPAVPVGLGSQPAGVTDARPFDGSIDDVRIYERALSAAEIQALMQSQSPPTAAPDMFSLSEDNSLTTDAANGVLSNDTDPEFDSLTAALVATTNFGSLTLAATGAFTYTPNENFSGTDSFRYRADDGTAQSTATTVTLTVLPQPDAPQTGLDSFTVDEDALFSAAAPGVLVNDSDVDGDLLTVTLERDVAHGALTLNADGSFTYQPDPDYFGEDSFTYTASDATFTSAPTLVTLLVQSVLDPPTAIDHTYLTDEDQTLSILAISGVLTGASNPETTDLSALVVTGPGHGTLNLVEDGSFTYTPDANYSGSDGFTYVATNGTQSNPATVTIIVDPVTDPPVANADAYGVIRGDMLTVDAGAGLLANDSNLDTTPLQAHLVTSPMYGQLNLSPDGSFTYQHLGAPQAEDSFSYRAANDATSAPAIVRISVVAQGLIAHWKFDEGTGTTVTDVASGLSGELQNGASWGGVAGDESSNHVAFDGVNDRVDLGHLDIPGSAMTIACWIKLDDFDFADARIISKATGRQTDQHWWMLSTMRDPYHDPNADHFLRFRLKTGGTTATLLGTERALQLGVWIHAAVVYDGSEMRVYQDGLLVGSLAKSGPIATAPHVAAAIGSQPPQADGARPFDGGIDDVRIYERALTQEEIQQLVQPQSPPTAVADAYSVTEDSPLSVIAGSGVLVNDHDPDSDPLSAVLASTARHGTLTLHTDGSFDYLPPANFSGVDTFTYRTSDGAELSAPATVTLTVAAAPDAPQGVSDAFILVEDTTLTVMTPGVLANDLDGDGDLLAAVIESLPAHGSVTVEASGAVTYVPAPDFHGTDHFSYRADDGVLTSPPTDVTLTVTPVNDPPVVNASAYDTDEDTSLIVPAPGLLAHATDVDGDTLNVVLDSDVTRGSLSLSTDGAFSYVPDANFFGEDSFTYHVGDGSEASATATVTLRVAAVVDGPVAASDQYTLDEDTTFSTDASNGVLSNDLDLDGLSLVAALLAGPSEGAVSLTPDGGFFYTPRADFAGTDQFTYVASNGAVSSPAVTVTLTITARADEPSAAPDSFTTAEDTPLVIAAPGVLGNDTDVDGDILVAAVLVDVANGTLSLNGDGAFTYTPTADFHGSDSFTYQAGDGTSFSNTVTVELTVSAVMDAPVASGEAYTVNEDAILEIPAPGVLANDVDSDGDALMALLESDVAHGTLALSAEGAVTYAPAPDFHGVDSFTYRATDGVALSDAVIVTLTVDAIPDAPTAVADAYEMDEDSVFMTPTPGVLGNDTDPDGDALTSVLEANVSSGVLTLLADGSFTYTPDENFVGTDSFSYHVTDGTLTSPVVTVSLRVNGVSDAPVAGDDSYSLAEDQDLMITDTLAGVLGNDLSLDGLALSALLIDDVDHGNLQLNADGTFHYTPTPDYFGEDTFTYQAHDGALSSIIATVTLTVTPQPEQPLALPESFMMQEATSLSVPAPGVLANDHDVDGLPLQSSVVVPVSVGTLTLALDGALEFTPPIGFTGSVTFEYVATNGTLDSDPVVVSIVVNDLVLPPITVEDDYAVAEDELLAVLDPALGILSNDSDSGMATLTALLVAGTSNGQLDFHADGTFSYLPDPDFSGLDGFLYVASNGLADSTVTAVVINVAAANDVPQAFADDYMVLEDTMLLAGAPGVLANDFDPDADTLHAVLVDAPSSGTLTLHADGAFVYVPSADFAGTDSFTYSAMDATLTSATTMVILNVLPVLDPATAMDDSYDATEDLPLLIDAATGVLANDVNHEATPLTAVLVSDPAHGVVSLLADGGFQYVPFPDYFGSDSFTYKATSSDGSSAAESNVATVTIQLAPTADPTTPIDDSYSVNDGQLLVITNPAQGVLANDSNPDGNPITAQLAVAPQFGTVTLDSDGTFSYQHTGVDEQLDSFSYQLIVDGVPGGVAQVHITIGYLDVGLVAHWNFDEAAGLSAMDSVGGRSGTLSEGVTWGGFFPGTSPSYVVFDGVDDRIDVDSFDLPGSAMTIASWIKVDDFDVADGRVVSKALGTQTLEHWWMISTAPNPSGSNPNHHLRFRLKTGDTTTTLLGTGVALPRNAWVHVAAIYDGNLMRLYQDGVLAGAVPMTGTIAVDPTVPVAVGNQPVGTSRAFDGAINDLRFYDRALLIEEVHLLAREMLAPIATPESYSVLEDEALTVPAGAGVLVNDMDENFQSLQALLVAEPEYGTVILDLDGAFAYTPAADFAGTDHFSYRATDGLLASPATIVTITVTPTNDAPTAMEDFFDMDEDSALTIEAPGVLNNDHDPDGDVLAAVLEPGTGPVSGALDWIGDGSFLYTPTPGFVGQDSFRYRADDVTAQSSPVTVFINVAEVIDPPIAAADDYITDEDTPLAISVPLAGVLGNDIDPNLSAIPLTALLVDAPLHGTLDLQADGTFTYVPNADYAGPDTFSYQAANGVSWSAITAVAITVIPVADPPVARPDVYSVRPGLTLSIPAPGLLGNDFDSDGDPLQTVLDVPTSSGIVQLAGDGSFTYQPNAGFTGTDSFQYVTDDGALTGSPVTVTIFVTDAVSYPATAITQYGITWTFDRAYETGQFANGDYWVVGPVTVVDIDPPSEEVAPDWITNGSMINPPHDNVQGYDSQMYGPYGSFYNPDWNVSFGLTHAQPLTVPSQSSLVSTISINPPLPNHRPALETAAVLTVLSEVPLPGSFRPPYIDGTKEVQFNTAQLDMSQLVATLSPVGNDPQFENIAEKFQRCWLDHGSASWQTRYMHPRQNMPDYARDMAVNVSLASLLLCMDYSVADKMPLLINFVQHGIDNWGIVEYTGGNTTGWRGMGGHGHGRKWQIIFAGLVLNHSGMTNVAFSDTIFGEDDQCFYVVETSPGVLNDGYGGYNYPEDIGLPEWSLRHAWAPQRDTRAWFPGFSGWYYRTCCTANSWGGYCLAAMAMNAKAIWNNDAFFDYQDRYMAVEAERTGIGSYSRQFNGWVEVMWDTYRGNYGPIWGAEPEPAEPPESP